VVRGSAENVCSVLDGSGYVHTCLGQPCVSEGSTRATAWVGLDLLYTTQL
jgi:hypothetical protein